MENRNNSKIWVLILGILLICSLSAIAVVVFVNQGVKDAQKALDPINDFTGNLGTQVSQVLNPTPTIVPDPITIISEVRTLSRLETSQYSVEKVITAEVGQDMFKPLFGDKLLFIAHGVGIAGVDLEKMGPDDLWLEGNVLYVRLPEPEIFFATLDNDKSYVYDRETGILTHGDVNLETTARQAAEQEIGKAALEDGILEQAGINAENYLYRLLRDLGYPEVIFERAESAPED
jgi:Protein of unknown function (DUF4230)